MCSAGDAWIIVSNGLLAFPLQFIRRKRQVFAHKIRDVQLDSFLVLRSGRNDLGIEYRSVLTDLIAMVEDAAGRFRAAITGSGPRLQLGLRRGRLVLLDNTQRFLAGIQDLEAAHDDALKRVTADRIQPCLLSRLLDGRRKTVEV